MAKVAQVSYFTAMYFQPLRCSSVQSILDEMDAILQGSTASMRELVTGAIWAPECKSPPCGCYSAPCLA